MIGNDVIEILLRALRSATHHVVNDPCPLRLVHPLTCRHAHAMATATDSLELGPSLPFRQGLRMTHEGTACAGN